MNASAVAGHDDQGTVEARARGGACVTTVDAADNPKGMRLSESSTANVT
jgi:hypothetical protein